MINSSFRSIICQIKQEVSPFKFSFTNKSIFELNSIISTYQNIHYTRHSFSTKASKIKKELNKHSNFKPRFLNSKLYCIIEPALTNKTEMEKKQKDNVKDNSKRNREELNTKEIPVENDKKSSENGMSIQIIIPKEKRRKKKNNEDPDTESADFLDGEIVMAAKSNDKMSAIKLFKSAIENKTKIYPRTLDTLLYLMTGGADWIKMIEISCKDNLEKEEDKKLKEEIEEIKKLKEPLLNVIEGEGNSERNKTEIMYLTGARLLACIGDFDGSLQCSKKAVLEGMQPKVRQFVPALVGYAVTGNIEGALRIERLMDGYDLILTELEFKLLFQAFHYGGSFEEFERLLKRLGEEQAEISQECYNYIEERFNYENKEIKKWDIINEVQVNKDGYNKEADASLSIRHMQEGDWSILIEGVKRIALEREYIGNDFQGFINWYEDNGPFDIIIDGANLALYGHSKALKFNLQQLDMAVKIIESKFKGKKILVILHTKRVKKEGSKTMFSRDFINRLKKNKQLFETPKGSNDDWYWLYAAVSVKEKGFLVTNDRCRDHIFQLLSPKYFYKWRNNQIMNFNFSVKSGELEFNLMEPALYTTCVQKLNNGNWLIPVLSDHDEIKWICIKSN